MSQILTDEEITLIIRECARGSAINRDGSTSHRIARAIEQAILNKLSDQEPVCYGNQTALDNMLDDRVAEVAGVRDGWRKTPLYLHPAPSVPEWQPIETAPMLKTVLLAVEFDGPGDWRIKCGSLYSNEWHVFGASWEPTHWMPLPKPPVSAESSD